jgi:hypothetical protein
MFLTKSIFGAKYTEKYHSVEFRYISACRYSVVESACTDSQGTPLDAEIKEVP